MLRQLVATLAACLLVAGQGSAFAQADGTDLLEPMRAFAKMVGGELAGDWKSGENIVTFSRSAERGLWTTGRPVPAAPGEWTEPAEGSVAIMRTRASRASGNAAPEAADFDFVGRTGIPVFILGLWSTPPVMWQIARQDGKVRWREVDVDAKAGPWHAAPAAASP